MLVQLPFALCLIPLALSAAAIAQPTPDSSPKLLASLDSRPTAVQPAVPISTEMRGDIYMARKMYRESIDMYRSLPETAQRDNKIGIAFHQMMEFKLAIDWYGRAIKLKPDYGEAINNIGTVFYSEKQYKKAITYYKRSLRNAGPRAPVLANLGAAYFGRRDYKQASQYYEEALALDPSVMDHREGFGTIMQEQTVTDLALFHLYLAKAYAKVGKNDQALIYLRKALEEGLKDRKKLPDVPEFGTLKTDPGFILLLAQNPKPL